MPTVRTSDRRIRFALALILTAASAPALAQYPAGATVQQLPRSDDPAELLAQALRTLATEPNNIQALTNAGQNALVLGDPNAAVGFFGRATELAPRDGRVKAGLGSALVQLEKPTDALRLFAEAGSLGVPDADLAEDRGLAYDLTGDNRRAQRDYASVLALHPDDDTVRRRLALSQGISGDKAAAIATLDPLIRKRDIAGWRAQTFVLAMNGDASGASYITHIMMPQQADRMQPFLVRLSTLSPADKARAVHFGEMPQNGGAYTPSQLATASAPATYAPAPVAPKTKPARHRTEVAAVEQDDLAPAPAPAPKAKPKPEIVAAPPEPAPLPKPTPAPAVPAPPAPTPVPATRPAEQVAVTTGAPAGTTGRFIGPPAETAPKPEVFADAAPTVPPPGTRVATPATPAPLAATAFGASDPAPVAASPAVDTAPAPVQTVPLPASPQQNSAVASAPAPEALAPPPVAVPTAKPAAATPSRSRPVRSKAPAAELAVDADQPQPKSKRAGHADEDAQATAKARDKGGRGAKDKTDDEPASTAKGKHAASRKDDTASADDSGDRKSGGKKSSKASSADSAKKKGAKSDDADSDTGTKKHGKGKGSKSDDSESAAPKVYVQVAGGANRDDMNKAWEGVKKKAPDLMKGHTPSTTPVKSTNRLLVGPFKSDEEAQAFVNKMAGKGLSGFTFKSSKGQKVEKIDSGK